MNFRKAMPKKFLKTSDFEKNEDRVLTIKSWSLEKVGRGDEEKEQKLALHFEESDQCLACNTTNAEIVAGIFGSEELDDWIGHRITLYMNPAVTFMGKRVGGLSVRDTKPGGAARAATPAGGSGKWTLAEALAAAEEVGVMKGDLRKILVDAGHKGWNPTLTPWLQKILADMAPPDESLDDTDIPF